MPLVAPDPVIPVVFLSRLIMSFRVLFGKSVHFPLAWGLVAASGVMVVSACSAPLRVTPSDAALPVPTTGCSAVVAPSSADAAPIYSPLVTFDSAWSIIRHTHWDTTFNGVDWPAVRQELRPRAQAARTRGELRVVLTDMVGRLRQSHFAVIPQEQAELASGTDATSAKHGGWLGMAFRLLNGAMVVTAVDTGGPAWTAGIRAGWTINSIRGCSLGPRLASLPADSNPRRVALSAHRTTAALLDGPYGDTIRVSLRGPGDRIISPVLTFSASPGTVTRYGNLPSMAADLGWQRVVHDGHTVGIIRFNVWMPAIAVRFDEAVDSLRTADAIVLDLRGNPGGVGGMAMGVAGHFVDTTFALGTMYHRQATVHMAINPRRVDTNARAVTPFSGPLAIVVDELSGSTTEIFTAGLQALHRATVFGSQTAGQALPAVSERLPNGDILYHAVADFVGPEGNRVEGNGVIPDHVTIPTAQALLGGHDPALEAALDWAARQPAHRPGP